MENEIVFLDQIRNAPNDPQQYINFVEYLCLKGNLVSAQAVVQYIHSQGMTIPSSSWTQWEARGITYFKDKKVTDIVMISVIVPTYNRPTQLLHAIRSILFQTYQDFEIIVINDNGIEVEDLILNLKDSRIRYIRHETNLGLAASRNTGIKLSKGKYIAYLDDDDEFYSNHLEILVNFLEQGIYQVAYTDSYRASIRMNGNQFVAIERYVTHSYDFDYDRILDVNLIPVLCVMHSRNSIIDVGLFDETLNALEDWELWIRLSRKYQFAHIPKVTCEFSWRTDGSTMTSKDSRREQQEAYIYNRYKVERQKAHLRQKILSLKNKIQQLQKEEDRNFKFFFSFFISRSYKFVKILRKVKHKFVK